MATTSPPPNSDTPSPRALPAFLQTTAANDVPPPPRTTRRPVPIDLLIVVALAVVTFLLYLPILSNQFIRYDDPKDVTDNHEGTAHQ
jgi:hypothetical protein